MNINEKIKKIRNKWRARFDEEPADWITVNGNHIPIDEDKNPIGGQLKALGQEQNQIISIEKPKIKPKWNDRLTLGKKLSDTYPGYSYEGAIKQAGYDGLIDDLFSDIENCSNKESFIREQFVKAGFRGVEPEYVNAIRYGEIPESGRSRNWADNSYENGVSTVKILRNGVDEDYKSIYDVTLGGQGIQKYIISGWYFGESGSDGEPLLIGPKIVKKL